MKEQPEALRLANSTHLAYRVGWQREAAAELRRLHHTLAAREDEIQTHSAAVYECTRLLAQAREQRDELQQIVAQQAEDEGLWFVAQTAAEAYLQQELRRLHAAVEGEK